MYVKPFSDGYAQFMSSEWLDSARAVKRHCIESGHPERLQSPIVQKLISEKVREARIWNHIAIQRAREVKS